MKTFLLETLLVLDAACSWLALRIAGQSSKAIAVWNQKIDRLVK